MTPPPRDGPTISRTTRLLATFFPETRFGGFTDIDGTVAFYNRVNALLRSHFRVLDLGCGRGASAAGDTVLFRKQLRILRGKVAHVIGIDVDLTAQENPYIDEFRLIEDRTHWPVQDHSIDLVVCDHVLEHVDDPLRFFSEIRRCLVKGGVVCVRTTNRHSYIGLAAALIPKTRHWKVLEAVQPHRQRRDIFPTEYRCNNVRSLENAMVRNGFQCIVYGYEPEPGYLSFSKIAYFFGIVHRRIAPKCLRPILFAFGRSPS